MVQCSWFKLQSSVRPTLERQCFPLISLIPNPTTKAHEFLCAPCALCLLTLPLTQTSQKIGPESMAQISVICKAKHASKWGLEA